MQNVSNLNCPFFGKDGKPISAGRVHFIKPDTSASDFNGISEFDYITIKNKNGATLQNPLPLDELGQFSIQPFVEDGVNFKMVVDKPTGIPSEYDNDIASWETQLVIDSKSFIPQMQYAGLTSVGSIAELRTVNPSLGKVEVTGYYEAGDCPSRVFVYKNESLTENYGTRIKSSFAGVNGYWVMVASDTIDVRWFGIKTSYSEKTDIAQRLNLIANEGITVLFPRGNYYISYDISLSSCIFEDGAKIFPFGNNNVKLTIGSFTNNGGKFCAVSNETNAARVIPCLTGVIKTSWLQGTLNDFISGGFPDNILEVVIDTYTESTTFKSLVGKVVHLVNGTVPSNLSVDSCIVINHSDKSIKAPLFKFGNFYSFDKNGVFKANGSTAAMLAQNEHDSFFFDFLKKIYADGGIFIKGNAKVASSVIAKKYVEIRDKEIVIIDGENPLNNIYIRPSGTNLKELTTTSLTVHGYSQLNGNLNVTGQLYLCANSKLVQTDYLNVSGGYNLTTNLMDEPAGRRLVMYNGAPQISATVQYWKVGVENEAPSNRKPSTIKLAENEAIELFSLGKKKFSRDNGTSVICTRWALFKRV